MTCACSCREFRTTPPPYITRFAAGEEDTAHDLRQLRRPEAAVDRDLVVVARPLPARAIATFATRLVRRKHRAQLRALVPAPRVVRIVSLAVHELALALGCVQRARVKSVDARHSLRHGRRQHVSGDNEARLGAAGAPRGELVEIVGQPRVEQRARRRCRTACATASASARRGPPT